MKLRMMFVSLVSLVVLLVSGVCLADPVGGFITGHSILGGSEESEYLVKLQAEQLTMFEIQGNGKSDLDCWVYDSKGDKVASSLDSKDHCEMSVYSSYGGTYKLKVKNLGTRINYFALDVW